MLSHINRFVLLSGNHLMIFNIYNDSVLYSLKMLFSSVDSNGAILTASRKFPERKLVTIEVILLLTTNITTINNSYAVTFYE